MPVCIYCQSDKSEKCFSKREHVVPQSFGTFKDNLTLKNIVCDDCNQYFGDNLEIALARDTVEGLSRFSHGIKAPDEFRPFGRNSRIVLRVAEGAFEGAYVYRQYSATADEILLRPLPQTGFLIGDKCKYYLMDEIPTNEELRKAGFDNKCPKAILGLGVDENQLRGALAEKGIAFEKGGELIPPKESEKILCQVEATIDQKIFRSVAKIATNYLAYWQGPDFLNEKSFDVVRRYIRYGGKPDYPLVITKQDAILDDEPITGKRRLGHLLTVNRTADGVSVIAQVSLFNWVTYCVSLARECRKGQEEIRKGHFFNVANNEIFELGARPKNIEP